MGSSGWIGSSSIGVNDERDELGERSGDFWATERVMRRRVRAIFCLKDCPGDLNGKPVM